MQTPRQMASSFLVGVLREVCSQDLIACTLKPTALAANYVIANICAPLAMRSTKCRSLAHHGVCRSREAAAVGQAGWVARQLANNVHGGHALHMLQLRCTRPLLHLLHVDACPERAELVVHGRSLHRNPAVQTTSCIATSEI